MSSRYPNQIDLFETKHNATSASDPAGDYVMAEHVNDIQDSILAIENTLGKNPEGSYSTMAERVSGLESTKGVRVSPVLVYLGKPALINGSNSIDEAVGHYLKYDNVILGSNAYDPSGLDNVATKEIILRTKSNRGVRFYGYLDASVLAQTISQIQIIINQWISTGVNGIYCDKFGFSNGVSRQRQNLILDSIHQYDMPAILVADNPDELFTDLYHAALNPDRIVPNVLPNDIYIMTSFAIDTSGASPYLSVSDLTTKINNLYTFRKNLGIKIFGLAHIQTSVSIALGQKYFDYAHALGVLYALDGFGARLTNYGSISNISNFYSWPAVLGGWFTKTPVIKVSSDGVTYSRETAFGKISIDGTMHTYRFEGISIPTDLLRVIPSTIDGSALIDASVPDSKIQSYNGTRLITTINTTPNTALININKITGLLDNTGGISEGYLSANVISAINANIGLAQIDSAVIGNLDANKITTGTLDATRISGSVVSAINLYAATMQVGSATIANAAIGTLSVANLTANVVQAVNLSTQNITAERMLANVVQAINLSAHDIAADRMRANVVSAINLYADNAQLGDVKIKAAAIGELDATNIRARSISADRLQVGSVTAAEIAAGSITGDRLAAGTITADQIHAGAITSDHIITGGLDAQIISVYDGASGEILIGGGTIRVNGLDAGVVQSDNLAANGLFMTASSGFGFRRDNPPGEAIVGTGAGSPGGNQIWKFDMTTDTLVSQMDIPGKKPAFLAIDNQTLPNGDIGKFAYISVQGDDTVVQLDLQYGTIDTKWTLAVGKGPGRIKHTGGMLGDHKHFFLLNTDKSDVNAPDSFYVLDAPPMSNDADGDGSPDVYIHHQIIMGNTPYDFVLDESNRRTYITLADQGDIMVLDSTASPTYNWKIIGAIPISDYGTDNYHGGMDGGYGIGWTNGGSSSKNYQSGMPGMHMSGGMAGHVHGGYGAPPGDLKTYSPRGIDLSTDGKFLYVADSTNGELVIVNKLGDGVDTGASMPMPMPMPMSVMDTTMTIKDTMPGMDMPTEYLNYGAGTTVKKWVKFRIPVGSAPEFIKVIGGKIFVTLFGSTKVAVVDEAELTATIVDGTGATVPKYTDGMMIPVRLIEVGSKPIDVIADPTKGTKGWLYVSINATNEVVRIDVDTEIVLKRFQSGSNVMGLALTPDYKYLYVANNGGSGLSFVYPPGNYIGDAYIGLEGGIKFQGAQFWTANRSNWVYNLGGAIKSFAAVEFHINEPLLNEGGFCRLATTGFDRQWAEIEQDIFNVTNFSDGIATPGTWYKTHNGSLLVAVENSSSSNYNTFFEVEEFVPKFITVDNQQTEPFTYAPIELPETNADYTGMEFSQMTKRSIGATVTSSVPPTIGSLISITNGIEPADSNEESGMTMPMSVVSEEPVFTIQHTYGEMVEFPSGLQSVTIDMGKAYMINKVVITHAFHQPRIYHQTKTEVSEDGIHWTTIYDSAVSGEYREHSLHPVHNHRHYGKPISFNAKVVRYIRDWANGYALYTVADSVNAPDTWVYDSEHPENHWTEIHAYGDWEVEAEFFYNYALNLPQAQVTTSGGSAIPTWGNSGARDLKWIVDGSLDPSLYFNAGTGKSSVTLDLGVVRDIDYIRVWHYYTDVRQYHETKTEISVDNVIWTTIFDSAVDGEYLESPAGNLISLGGLVPVRYIRDWINGSTVNTTLPDPDNRWIGIHAYNGFDTSYKYKYQAGSDHEGQNLASNGRCFVTTNISAAWMAIDLTIDFTSWWYMTYIRGPEFGQLGVGMPTVMGGDHFLQQDYTFITKEAHRHIMNFPPSTNVKADEMMSIKAGKHRAVMKQVQGRISIDRFRFEDYQRYRKTTTVIPYNASKTFVRYKITPEQAKAYQGQGNQSTEGAYDTIRINPHTKLPDKSVPIKYRVKVRGELNPVGNISERGISYVTSGIFETGKNSTHWRRSESSDLVPGNRVESWDGLQPHTTGIQWFHLANGAIRGTKILPSAIMNYHVSPYAKIAEHKLDLNYPTHQHGMWMTDAMGMSMWMENKSILDMIMGFGLPKVDNGTGTMVEPAHSGTSDNMARANHWHLGMVTATGTPTNGMVPVSLSGSVSWAQLDWNQLVGKPITFPPSAHGHITGDITDLPDKYYNKTEVDAMFTSPPGTGGAGNVYTYYPNEFTQTNTFNKSGLALLIKPSVAAAPGTALFQALNFAGDNLLTINNDNTLTSTGSLTITGNVTAGGFTTTGIVSAGTVMVTGNINTATLSTTGAIILGVQATDGTHAVRADRTITTGVGLTGGGDLTQNRTISITFAGSGVANTVARSDHAHSGYVTTGNDQYVGNNFTVLGNLFIGATGQYGSNGDIIIYDAAGTKAIHFDGDSTGKIDALTVKAYINGTGLADFAGKVSVGSLVVNDPAKTLVANLNAELLNGKPSKDYAGMDSVKEASGYGVFSGYNIGIYSADQVQFTPDAGETKSVVYTQTGRRYSHSTIEISTQWNSTTFTRYDIIYIKGPSDGNTEGDITVMAGNADGLLQEPIIPSDAVKLYRIRRRPTASINASDITDYRQLRPLRYDKVKNRQLLGAHIQATKSATKLTIPAGQKSVAWAHQYGDTNYVISAMANNVARHIYYKNQTSTTIEVWIDDTYDKDIELHCILIGY